MQQRGTPPTRSAHATWFAGILVLASSLHFWFRNLADPDLWGHLEWGRRILETGSVPRVDTSSYTAYGRPFFDHEWLADLVIASLFALGGSPALIAMKLGFGLLLLLLLLDATRTLARDVTRSGRVHPLTLAAVLIAALAVIAPGATFRPQLFTMLFGAAEGALLARAERRLRGVAAGRCAIAWELAAVPPLLAAWANLHGGFLVGVGMLGIYAGAVALRARPGGRPSLAHAGAVAAIALAGGLAPLANPYGLTLYTYLASTLHLHGAISEWKPVSLLGGDFLRFKLLVVATAVLLVHYGIRRRTDTAARALLAWQGPLLALAAVYAFRHQRHTVLFAILAAPMLAVAAEEARRRVVARWPGLAPRPRVRLALALGAAGIAAVQLFGVAQQWAEHGLAVRFARIQYPIDALEFLRMHGIRGNIATQFEWGAYTIHKLGKEARVFIDGRFEAVYPPQVIEDYFAFVNGRPGWERLLDAYPTEVLVVQRSRNIHPRLFARPDLTYLYSDPAALVFVRRTATNAEALGRLLALAQRPPLKRADTVFP